MQVLNPTPRFKNLHSVHLILDKSDSLQTERTAKIIV